MNRRAGAIAGLSQVKIVLVLVLFVLQSAQVSGSEQLVTGRGIWSLTPICVGALAAILGFSAAASRVGERWRGFVIDRLRLAIPVYWFAVLGGAFAVGALVTNESKATYFTDPETLTYLTNLVGWPQYSLPGVFEFNDLPGIVNQNVWVAPFFPLILAAAAISSHRRVLRLLPAIFAVIVIASAILAQGLDFQPGSTLDLSYSLLRGDGLSALIGGLGGVAIFRQRARVPLDWRLAIAAGVAIFAIALVGNPGWLSSAVFRAACGLPVAYLAVYVAMRRLPIAALANKIVRYLTGVFLFSFPLQQLAAALGPQRDFVVNVAISLPASIILAVAFWYGVGRWLVPPRLRLTHVDPLLESGRQRASVLRRVGPAALLTYLALTAVFVAAVLGVMGMIYLAMQADSGGM